MNKERKRKVKMAKKKQIAKAKSTDVVVQERPDYLGEEERGQENVGSQDVIIPRLDVVQSISPQRKKNDPAYIEGAEEGMLFNTVSDELYGNSVMFVPVYFRKEWVIWKSRKAGGGFNGAFATEVEANHEMDAQEWTGKKDDKGGDLYEVTDVGQHFGLIIKEDGSLEDVVISMSKSKMKVSRQLNTMVKMAGGDRFSRIYGISSVEDQNKQGDDYYNLSVKSLGFVNEETYRAAEKTYDSIRSGQKDVSRDDGETGGGKKEYEA